MNVLLHFFEDVKKANERLLTDLSRKSYSEIFVTHKRSSVTGSVNTDFRWIRLSISLNFSESSFFQLIHVNGAASFFIFRNKLKLYKKKYREIINQESLASQDIGDPEPEF